MAGWRRISFVSSMLKHPFTGFGGIGVYADVSRRD
jgi:hypothetical protein